MVFPKNRERVLKVEDMPKEADTNWRLDRCILIGILILCPENFQEIRSFLPENSKAGYYSSIRILKQGHIFFGNRPNFFVEHMTESQNQLHYFKSGNIYIWM